MLLSELKLNPDNPRSIKQDKLEKLAQSIKDFPKMMIKRPIVYDENKVIIGGNMRYRAIQSLGMKEIPDEWTSDASDFTPDERYRFIMQDNAEMGEHDWDMVANQYELEDLDAWGIDVPYADLNKEVEEDEAPEVSSEPPVSQLGVVYQLGRHRVMCGDSTDKANVELLMNGEKADMVFTDPPYGMDLDADYADIHTSRDTTALGGGKQRSHTNYEKVIGDSGDFDFGCIATICDMADEVFLWGADYYIDSVPNSGKGGSWIVWNKKPKGDMGKAIGNQFEICWSKQKHKRIVIDYTYSGAYGMKPNDGNRVHPTQKPIDLIAQMFERWGKDKQNIIDLFLGSGSTLIACEQTDRTCYGMELDPKYVDVIRKRYAKFISPDDTLPENWEELTPAIERELSENNG